jgi:hypothetical protein
VGISPHIAGGRCWNDLVLGSRSRLGCGNRFRHPFTAEACVVAISTLVLDRTRAHYLVTSTAPLVSGRVWIDVEVNVRDLAVAFDPGIEEIAELADGALPRTSGELQTDREIIEAWSACWVAVEQGKRFPAKVQDNAIRKKLGSDNGPHPSRIRAAFASLKIDRMKRPT